MSKTEARAFLERLEQDPGFKERLQHCRTEEEFIALLQKSGFHFTQEEIKEVFQENSGHELSEEELAQYAAGVIGAGAEMFQWQGTNG